jgi:hypothetical protein
VSFQKKKKKFKKKKLKKNKNHRPHSNIAPSTGAGSTSAHSAGSEMTKKQIAVHESFIGAAWIAAQRVRPRSTAATSAKRTVALPVSVGLGGADAGRVIAEGRAPSNLDDDSALPTGKKSTTASAGGSLRLREKREKEKKKKKKDIYTMSADKEEKQTINNN